MYIFIYMATLQEYFLKDFSNAINFPKECVMENDENEPTTFLVKLVADYRANSKLLSFYFEPIIEPFTVFKYILNSIEDFFQIVNGDFKVQDIFGNVSVKDNWISLKHGLKFTGRVVFYYNGVIDRKTFSSFQSEFKSIGLFIQCFDMTLMNERNDKQKPVAFISHDSRDKSLAREIAIELEKRMCTVWFDEFTLEVGDSLRESIEKGLLECKKCIIILSPHFITNEGWTKTEFNAIFTREIVETKKLVLPVWHNVNGDDVFHYSPTLKDRFGVNSEKGLDFVVNKLHRAIVADQ